MRVAYIKPEVISYSHHAFPLGIILNQRDAKNWMLANYINLYTRPGINAFNFLVNYDSNPFLDMRNIYYEEINTIIDHIGLKEWLLFELNQSVAVELLVDFFYLPSKEQYHIEHFMHEIMITGYLDNNRVIYWNYVNQKYQEIVGNWEDIRIYNTTLFYGDGIGAKLYKSKSSTYELNSNIVKKQINDFASSVNLYQEIAIWGDYEQYRHCSFGIDCTKVLIEEIDNKDIVDIRYINVFYEHKKLFYLRLQALEKQESSQWCEVLSSYYEELSRKWWRIMNFAIKVNLYNDMERFNKGKTEIGLRIASLYEEEKGELQFAIDKYI